MTKDSQPGRMGWRGISAPVTYYATDRKQDGYGAYIAIGEDPDDGELTLSLWTSVGGIGERLWAIWLPAGSKAALIAALTATPEPLKPMMSTEETAQVQALADELASHPGTSTFHDESKGKDADV